jgi:hypothetical protein
MKPLYVKILISCFFPLVCIMVIGLFWFILSRFKESIRAVDNFIVSIIVLIFVCLPPITNITFAMFSCLEIFQDGDSYLALDLDVKCWSGQHNVYSKAFGIPILIVWIIGLPLIALIALFRRRQ